jgi:predicted alpha/beta-fold hydrolase
VVLASIRKPFTPPLLLKNGLSMTLYTALRASRDWEKTTTETEPFYQETIFTGAGECQFLVLLPFLRTPEAQLLAPMGLQVIWITNGFSDY